MSAYRPNAIVPTTSGSPTGFGGIVHEDPDQLIQGGQSNEHYHLTEAEHTYLTHVSEVGIPLYEPIAVAGEIIFDSVTGDVYMGLAGYI